MADKGIDEGLSVEDVIRTIVREELAENDRRSRVELVKFSGKADDVITAPDGRYVYLRCTSERRRDGEGQPTPMVLRLASVGGHWTLPTSETEFVGLLPEDAATATGAGYAVPLDPTPPAKLSLGKTFMEWANTAKVLFRAAAFMFRTAAGASFGLDEDGKFVVSLGSGTRFEAESGAFRFVVTDAAGVATALVIDATGVTVACAPGGVPTITWKIDGASGGVTSAGIGPFAAQHPFGFLGVTSVNGVGYVGGSGMAASGSWMVQP